MPQASVTSGFLAGALMRTFLAPPVRCLPAESRSTNRPVDSMTMSAPNSFQGILPGSFSAAIFTSSPEMKSALSRDSTTPGKRPWTES